MSYVDGHSAAWRNFYDEEAVSGKQYPPIQMEDSGVTVFNELPAEHTVVDIGCGYGRVIPALPVLGVSGYLGIDFSGEQIAMARALFPGHRFEMCCIFEMGARYPALFDGFILNAVFMCITRARAVEALASVRASLKSRAVGFIATPYGNGRVVNGYGMPIHQYGTHELMRILAEAQFDTEEMFVTGRDMILCTVRAA